MSDSFSDAVVAFDTVKKAVDDLRAEYVSVCAAIEDKKATIQVKRKQYIPLADLKAAILDYVDSTGTRYAEEYVRPFISGFASNEIGSIGVYRSPRGYPMSFDDLERVNAGADLVNERIVTCFSDNGYYDTPAQCFFFGELVKAGLSKVMADMTDDEFGYGMVEDGEIGSDRVTRRAEIAALNAELETLSQRKKELEVNLRALGGSF